MTGRDDERGGFALTERRFPANADAPGAARALLRAQIQGLEEHAAASLFVAVSELVTNAVLHGDGHEVTVRCGRRDHRVRVEVWDAGTRAFAWRADEQPDRDRVHGLEIVGAFTDRFGVERAPHTVAWFELDLGPNGLG